MKANRRFLGICAIAAASACLIAPTWLGTVEEKPVACQRGAATGKKNSLAGQAPTLGTQIVATDRMPPVIATAYEVASTSVSLADVHHRSASVAALSAHDECGPAAFKAVAGLADSRLGAVGARSIGPDTGKGRTTKFEATRNPTNGVWIGLSPIDAVTRFHAFRYLSGHTLAVAAAADLNDGMQSVTIWRRQANLFSGCVTILLAVMGLLMVRSARLARRREAALAEDRAMVASANAQLEVARAVATAKAEQLEATLDGMTDGVAMFDAQMRLVEWNARFPEVAGVPADILRIGLPMEEVLHAQIKSGQFGKIAEPEAEVRRRMLRLRTGSHGVVQRQRPDGHTLELRRKRLPEGGFVTLYADVTDHKRAEEALLEARVQAEKAAAAKSRFAAIVSHEIRIPLDALLNTLRALADGVVPPGQRSLLATARQLGHALSGLTNDILEMAQVEAGKLMIRPSLVELRPLLETSVEMLAIRAAERGITFRVSIADRVPATLVTDGGRLRQVLLNLLSNAVERDAGGEIRVEAETGRTAADVVTLLVRDTGPAIDATLRSRLLHPPPRLEQPNVPALSGSGLGLSICRELVTLMGGSIGCETWTAPDGQRANAFWLSLPTLTVPAPFPPGPAPLANGQIYPLCRHLPRTRILLVEDLSADQFATATLLRRDGHLVDIVSGGEAAIKAIQQVSYDLVLMDTELPGLSCAATTRAVRSLAEPIRSTPILALAVNASAENKDSLYSLGVDGVLDKPVSGKNLADVLHPYVWSGHRGGNPRSVQPWVLTRAGSIHPEAVEPGADHPVLSADRILELRSNLAPQTFVALIEECLVDLDGRLPALRGAFAAGSISAVTVHSHAMVGMAAGYGMETLETSLRKIMAAARAGDAGSLGLDAFAEVERELASAARALRSMLQTVVA